MSFDIDKKISMTRRCIAPGCNSREDVKGIHFYGLPLNCYLRDLKSELTNSKRKYMLKERAITTIFHFSQYKQVRDIPT